MTLPGIGLTMLCTLHTLLLLQLKLNGELLQIGALKDERDKILHPSPRILVLASI